MAKTETETSDGAQTAQATSVTSLNTKVDAGYASPSRREDGRMLVTMIQGADKQTRRVRIGDLVEFDVLASGMIPGDGQTNYNFTIGNIEIAYDKVRDAAG